MITKEFLKRETKADGEQFYPISREAKHILKCVGGKINIKIRPRRKYDEGCQSHRKCIQVKVESENSKGARGMARISQALFRIYSILYI